MNNLTTSQKSFFDKVASEAGYERCNDCEKWFKKDELSYNEEIHGGGLCEDCLEDQAEFDDSYLERLYAAQEGLRRIV